MKNESTKAYFGKLYQYLNDYIILNQTEETHLVEYKGKTLLGIQVFGHALFILCCIKTFLNYISFILLGIYFNINIFLSLVELALLTLFKKLSQKSSAESDDKEPKYRPTLLKWGPINVTHNFLIMAFNIVYCFEGNMTNYYYTLQYGLSHSIIFGTVMIITYFYTKEEQYFNLKIQYIYILNFFLFVLFFPSFNNFINFFLPIYLVLGIFVFLNILVKEYITKANKTSFYHTFLEELIISILKTDDFFITMNQKIVLKNPESKDVNMDNLLTNDKLNQVKDNITSNLSDFYENEDFNNTFMKTFPINDNLYKGFHLVKKDYKTITGAGTGKADFSFMIWVVLYLKDTSLCKFNDNEIMIFYGLIKDKLKPSKAKNFLVEKIENQKFLIAREKLLSAIFLYVLEIGLQKNNIQLDKFLIALSTNNKEMNLKISKNFIEESPSILGLMNTFQDILKFFGLRFSFKISDLKVDNELKTVYDFDLSFENEMTISLEEDNYKLRTLSSGKYDLSLESPQIGKREKQD